MFGAVWAQAEVRKVLSASGARVIDAELAVPYADKALAEPKLIPDLEPRLSELLVELTATAERLLVT
jgi:chromate reductase